VSIVDVAVNAKGDRVITVGADGAARIWDVRSGRQLAVLHTSGQDIVEGASFSTDGRFVGSATYEGNVNVWDASTGKPLFRFTLPHRAGATAIRMRTAGTLHLAIVSGTDGDAYLLNAAKGILLFEVVTPGSNPSLVTADYSPASGELMTAGEEGSDGVIRIWRYNDKSSDFTEVGRPLVEKNVTLNDAEFSSDGSLIVTADDATANGGGTARIWDSSGKNPKPLATITEPGNHHDLKSAVFSQTGKLLILTASDDGTARVWDPLRPRHPLQTITNPQNDPLRSAAFSPNSRWIATAGEDGTARVWDRVSGRDLLTLAGHSGTINTVAFNSQGTRIVTASADGTAKVWEALPVEEQGLPIGEGSQTATNTVAFSPNGRVIATANADGYTRLWDATTNQHRALTKLPEPGGWGVSSAEFSGDGRWLVTGDSNGNGELWDTSTYKPLAPLIDPKMYSLSSAEISPDGTSIVSAGTPTASGGNNGVAVWGIKPGSGGSGVHVTLLRHIPAGSSLRWAAFSPDGKLIVTSDNSGTAKIWDFSTGHQVGATLTEPGGGSVSDAWFSPALSGSAPEWLRRVVQSSSLKSGSDYERWLVITSSDDGTARVWNMRTGAQVAVFTEPAGSSIYNAVFSPNGQLVLTNSQDGTARIWSLRTTSQMTQFNAGNAISDAEFSPRGNEVVTGGDFGVTRVFWTALDQPISQLVATAGHRLTRRLTAAELAQFASGG
jgi:WD40 repeat protein